MALICTATTGAAAQQAGAVEGMPTAAQLQAHCMATDKPEESMVSSAYCRGMIAGVSETAMSLIPRFLGKPTICPEEDASPEAMRLAFLRYAENMPEALDLPAATIVLAALQTSFPCDTP